MFFFFFCAPALSPSADGRLGEGAIAMCYVDPYRSATAVLWCALVCRLYLLYFIVSPGGFHALTYWDGGVFVCAMSCRIVPICLFRRNGGLDARSWEGGGRAGERERERAGIFRDKVQETRRDKRARVSGRCWRRRQSWWWW